MKIKQLKNKKVFNIICDMYYNEYKDDIDYNSYDLKAQKLNLFNRLVEEKTNAYAAIDNDNIIGFITIELDGNDKSVCTINNIFVLEEFRDKKAGKQLMLYAENIIKNLGFKQIGLGARSGKEGFYYKCGYVGEGMLQSDKFSKTQLEQILKDSGIKNYRYNFWNNQVHQFFFDEREILNNASAINIIKDKYRGKINIRMVFNKKI